jgi:colanic acid biosynthesis glycosyl transferase WcaI
MRALLIDQYFPPDTSATAGVFADLVEVLVDRGHEVTVICGRPSYRPTERLRWRLRRTRSWRGAEVHYLGSTALGHGSLPRRLVDYLSFLILAAISRLLDRTRHDVVVVGTDPPLVSSVAVRWRRGAPVVVSLQDLHPEAAMAAGWVRPGRLARYWTRLDTRALRKAELIACIGRDMERALLSRGIEPDRISIRPNGGRFPDEGLNRDVGNALRGPHDFLAVYAGNLGSSGAWETLLAADRLLGDEAHVMFIGDGSRVEQLKTLGADVHPFLPPEQISAVMEAGDLQIVTLLPGLEGASVPSKLYTILACGRPVLAVVPQTSEVAELIEELGCGIVVDPTDAEAVAEAIRMAKVTPGRLDEMGRAAEQGSLRFERMKCMNDLAVEIEATAKGSARLR